MKKIKFNGWAILSTIFILMIVIPNINVISYLFGEPNENWYHIKEFLLKDYIVNTIIICIFTGILTMILGTSLAWLTSAYEFPMRRFFRWALILPLSIPPYIAAYTYAGMLSYTGSIQTFLRNNLELEVSQKYFDIMSVPGAIFIFTIFLLPYVYIVVRSYLEKQSASLIENARLLGENSLGVFFRVVIPISRIVIVSGVTLVILEVLSDYGVVSYFGIQTFSTAIFKSWFSMSDVNSAIRLAAILLLAVFVVMNGEKFLRGRKKYSATNTKIRPLSRKKLNKLYGTLAFLYCGAILSLGFIIPTLQLISWAIMSYSKVLNSDFFILMYNSLWVAVVSSVLIVIMSIIIANYTRINDNLLSKLYSKITLVGYSIPGAVIAITMVIFFVDVDKSLSWLYKMFDPNSPTLVLSMSLVMLIFAYLVRFLAVGYQSIEGGFEKTGKKFYEASRTLGYSKTKTFFLVDLPMIKPAILASFSLVFVDIVKELPLALLLRPFNFHTLSTKVFEYANDEMIVEASIPSLIIILLSFITIFVLYKVVDKEN
ncbi:iron ABC transporter permease [Romboutsia weinsteinii]|uniref:Iron ABC transporter permease n=1 Tax=Romboutsia weinsteinii TaxID=2020949 RepID=A0A371J8T7_9FIRM|nr:iron ABC transporter permease [Romboutsia weinsteinii]RDY29145.1 iron ABC transporter permease [Romboutsia weinsteinii]